MFTAEAMFDVQPVDRGIEAEIQHVIDFKTKPLGALGVLERVAKQICLIQQTTRPQLQNPQILLFAGDHGITEEGVSPFPQAVTQQMTRNFLAGGAGVNVFCRQHDIDIEVIDAGINGEMADAGLINAKIANGTKNFAKEAAMTALQCEQAIARGALFVRAASESRCNVIGFGEMGIGNTSSASAIFASLSGIPVADCIGRGTGLNDEGLKHKQKVLEAALAKHGTLADAFEVLRTFGGLEIAMMVGAILAGCEQKMVVLIDGFIASAAACIAFALEPPARDYCVFTHLSNESGHRLMLDYLGVEPIVSMGLRLGEGSGVAVTYPLVQSAVNFVNEMASFDDAAIDGKENLS